jgi:hypothetical protein
VLAVFATSELRRRDPLFPFSIFGVKGLAVSDATQMIAFAAFVSVFYFLTLYMQDVLGYNAGVAPDQAGLAAGLLNASQQLGTALGLAIFSAIAAARTGTLLAAHAPPDVSLTAGFQRALQVCAVFLLAAAVIALRAANSRGEPPAQPSGTPAARDQVPAPELAD